MNQEIFENASRTRWERFEAQLDALEKEHHLGQSAEIPNCGEFPRCYRRICSDLALAKQRRYSPLLQDRLNALALRGHQCLYERKPNLYSAIGHFVAAGFPRFVRAELGVILLAAALFYLPGLLLFGFTSYSPELIYSLYEPSQVSEFEAMYDPASERFGTNREAATDIQMFGYYIRHNISISFQTFAGGIFAGIGSIFFLIYNGLILGALSAHMLQLHYELPFFSFIIGHAAFELTAIVLSGAAGLRLGYAIIAPGRYKRSEALRRAARRSVRLIYGVVILLLIAALIEAFWSSKGAIAFNFKFVAGAFLWAAIALYFTISGRSDGT